MAERLHRWAGATLWRGMLAVVILLAIYVSGSRVLLGALPRWSPWLIDRLEERSGGQIEVRRLYRRTSAFYPAVALVDSAITLPR